MDCEYTASKKSKLAGKIANIKNEQEAIEILFNGENPIDKTGYYRNIINEFIQNSVYQKEQEAKRKDLPFNLRKGDFIEFALPFSANNKSYDNTISLPIVENRKEKGIYLEKNENYSRYIVTDSAYQDLKNNGTLDKIVSSAEGYAMCFSLISLYSKREELVREISTLTNLQAKENSIVEKNKIEQEKQIRVEQLKDLNDQIKKEKELFFKTNNIEFYNFPLRKMFARLESLLDIHGKPVYKYQLLNMPEISKDILILQDKDTNDIHLIYSDGVNHNTFLKKGKKKIGEIVYDAEIEAGNKINKNNLSAANNSSNYASMQIYFASTILKEKGYNIESLISTNLNNHYVEVGKENVPYAKHEISEMQQKFSPILDLFLSNPFYFEKMKMVQAGHFKNKKQHKNISAIENKLSLLKKYFNDKDYAEIKEHINLGEYIKARDLLLSVFSRKKKNILKEDDFVLKSIFETINYLQEQDLSGEFKQRNTGDIGIQNFLLDARQSDNYYIQSILDIIEEKLYKTKQLLLPGFTKINSLAAEIIEAQPDKVRRQKKTPIANTAVFFENMIHKKRHRIYVNPDVYDNDWAKSKENREGWAKLSKKEKEFSDMFVHDIRYAYIQIYGEEMYYREWEDGMLPVAKKREDDQFLQSLKKGNIGGIKEAIGRMAMHQLDFNQVSSELKDTGVPNYYMYMNRDNYDETIEKVKEEYGGVEEDLLKIYLQTVSNLTKKSEFDKIESYFHVVKKMAENETYEDGRNNNKNTLALLDGIYDKYFAQRKKETSLGHDKYDSNKTIKNRLKSGALSDLKLDDVVSLASKYSSLVTMALSPANDVKNFLQGLFRYASRAIAGSLAKRFGANPPITVSKLAEHYAFVFSAITDPEKKDFLSQLMKIANTHQSDITDYANPKFLTSDKRSHAMRHGMFFIFNYLGDYTHRAVSTLALIDEEIGLDAYKMQDGIFTYDETKDKRYSNQEGKLVIDYIKRKGYYMGIDNRMATKYKTLSNEMFGAYDSDTLQYIELYSWGNLFLQFRRFLPAFLAETFAKGKYIRPRGTYKIKDGKVIWDADFHEGMFFTLTNTLFNPNFLKALKKDVDGLDPKKVDERRKNAAKIISDISFLTLLLASIAFIDGDPDGEDDDEKYGLFQNKYLRDKFRGMPFDFIQTLNPNTYLSLLANPFLMKTTLDRTISLLNYIYKYARYGYFEKESAYQTKRERESFKGIFNNLFKILPIANSAYNMYNQSENILYERDVHLIEGKEGYLRLPTYEEKLEQGIIDDED